MTRTRCRNLFMSQIYTDLFLPGDAVQASREAVARLPYLETLNQVASDQKGSANFGAALAFAGMGGLGAGGGAPELLPVLGCQPSVLADRYAGEFNKNPSCSRVF